jgi:hypothetical protein
MNIRFAVPAALATAVACGGGIDPLLQPTLRTADRAPDAFVLPACQNPLFDPADRTELRLVRSAHGRGDYEVPNGKYGVREAELLRLECGSGRTVGVVKK